MAVAVVTVIVLILAIAVSVHVALLVVHTFSRSRPCQHCCHRFRCYCCNDLTLFVADLVVAAASVAILHGVRQRA